MFGKYPYIEGTWTRTLKYHSPNGQIKSPWTVENERDYRQTSWRQRDHDGVKWLDVKQESVGFVGPRDNYEVQSSLSLVRESVTGGGWGFRLWTCM